jgi:hypothetical protein
MTAGDTNGGLRRGVYLIFAAIALGGMLGRILAVNSVDKIEADKSRQAQGKPSAQRPFLSSNDRSRWATVRALVEHGTYQIDEIVAQPNWDTIDMVKLPDGHLYSSKPPLFPTLMAGEYWLIHKLTGKTLGTHPYEIGRFMVITINVLPMLVYFAVVARLIDRYGTTDWGRIFTFATAALGTFLTTFVIVINNHLPAAVCIALATDAAMRIWCEGARRWRWFFLTGLFAALAAALELPALAFTAAMGLALLWRFPGETLRGVAPAMAIVFAAALGTNYAALGTIEPAYAHKEWYDYTFVRDGKPRESYWRNPAGIDRGEPSRSVYALNTLVGHHGAFSLSPVWLLAVAGMGTQLCRRGWPLRGVVGVTALLTVACFAFYVMRPIEDRNYGGMTSGLRWTFWLIPLWLLTMLPAVDAMSQRRWLRGLALALLVLSVLSVTYPTWNPWTHPWLTNFALYEEWIRF